MRLRILGSAAGGGFPQWNCRCTQCNGVRAGLPGYIARTQSSIAVEIDAKSWLLLNASPDLRQQLSRYPDMQPSIIENNNSDENLKRHSPLCGVILTDGQIDHSTGLLFMREGKRIPVFGTAAVKEDLKTCYPILNMLEHFCGSNWHDLPHNGEEFTVEHSKGIVFESLALSDAKPPRYSFAHQYQSTDSDIDSKIAGFGVALRLTNIATKKSVLYAPALGHISDKLKNWMKKSDVLLLDGTCFTDNELESQGLGSKKATQMGHLPLSGKGALLEQIAEYSGRKILVHINNSNPILNEFSDERKILTKMQVEVAYDGLEIEI